MLAQRGKMEKLPLIPSADPLLRKIFCIRVAALLHLTRDDLLQPPLLVKASASGFLIEMPAKWLQENPLTAGALAEEAQSWEKVGWQLRLRRRTAAVTQE